MAEVKEDEKWSNELDDCDEESIVTGHDSRKKMIQSPDKHLHIIRCIGELAVDFRYVDKEYKPTGPGTATVFHVTDDNKKAFAITAAHCIKSSALECTKCEVYMATKYRKKNNKIIKRKTCKNCYSGDYLKPIILNATEINFTRNEIKTTTTATDADGENVEYCYGDPKETYRCKFEYIPDEYVKSPHPKSGYDYAIISFEITDKYPYNQYSQNVSVQNVQSKLANKKIECFRIFGYPQGKKGMYGHNSTGKKYETKVNEETKRSYLEQKEVDTTIGQSGSVLWYISNDKVVIFCIHTGGSDKHKYNVATIIDDTVLCNISKAFVSNGLNFVPCLSRLDPNRSHRILMVVGEAGSGKTTVLNSMMNYLWGVEFEDRHRFQLKNKTESEIEYDLTTTDVAEYHLAPPKLDFQLTVIDTPGFGQFESIEDAIITKRIKDCIDALPAIDAVCLVFKSHVFQRDYDRDYYPKMQYIFAQLLNLFGNDIEENIFVLCTFADGAKPPVVDVFDKIHGNYKQWPWFPINTRCFSVDLVEEKNAENIQVFNQAFWKMGMKSFEELFKTIAECETNSLKSTKRVLQIRNQIQSYLCEQSPIRNLQINSIRSRADELEKIALRPTPLLPLEYIELICECSWLPNNMIKRLQKIRKQQALLSYALKNGKRNKKKKKKK